MNRISLTSRALGAVTAGNARPVTGGAALRDALAHVGQPVHLVEHLGKPALSEGGVAKLGVAPSEGELPLIGFAPALTPDRLGDAGFLQAYGVRAAYVAGEMANGIASEALVEAVTRAGYLGVFGAAGLSLERVTKAIDRLTQSLPEKTWGINLIHSPDDQKLEAALVELFLARKLRFVSASAYLDLTLPVVRYRAAGIHRDSSGAIVVPNRVMAKVSRVEVASKFLEPAPAKMLAELVAKGQLTAQEAELAAQVPMADDVTAEADSGGHTDNRPLVLLLPALQALRDQICARHSYAVRPRIGAAGGLATPASIASAFSMGAAYVVTGSINQATREAGTSDAVREMLSKAGPTDVAMAPAADMFEMGVKVQVLSRGTLFAVRAQRLYELYRTYASLEALPAAVKEELETKFFKSTLDEAWQGCVQYFTRVDADQLTRAAREPKHRMALVFRAYLGQASRWANDGVADRKIDYQVWCGPAMGAFNAWAQGSVLESWTARDAVLIARNLMIGACALTRAAALRGQGVVLPAEVEQFAPRTHLELDALLATSQGSFGEPAVQPERSRGQTAAKEPIAIIGMGALFPKAHNLQELWKLLRTGDDAIEAIPSTHWSLADFYDADPKSPDRTYAKRGGFLPTTPFDPTEFGIPPSILEATDTSQLLSLVVARMALEDAGYGEDVSWNRSRASVLLGVTGTQELVVSLGARLGHDKWKKALADAGVDAETAQDVVSRISASYVGWQENSFPGLLGNVVAGRIANRFDFGGTNCVIDAACASSLGALHLALAELESGRTDLVLTGGVDTLNDIFMHMCFSKTPALSPSGDVRPFSEKADGTLLGEGIGMVVLKRLSDAERDGDRVYAVIRGMGTSSDGRAKSIYAPLASGQARALEAAYRDAGVTPRDISLLEAHGTGTKAGDAAEFEALEKVYRASSSDAAWCALGSVKAQVGHTKAAAGAAGLIKAALALHHRVLPPAIKIDRPNPALKIDQSPFALAPEARPWLSSSRGPRRAAVSSFGFGGSNFHTVLEEYGTRRGAPAWDGSVELVALSAADAGALTAKLSAWSAAAQPAAFARDSRAAFRSSDAHRLLIVVTAASKRTELAETLTKRIAGAPLQSFSTPDGAVYGVGAVAGELAFLFPGQGAQHVDMLRELACLFPEVLEAVEADSDIARAVYPLPTFDAELQKQREANLTRTDVAQPALGAVERGLLNVLARFGIEPKLVAGHSYGELVALHAAGVLSAEGLAEASRHRGRLMAGDGSDRGTMLAVLAPLADIEKLIAEENLPVVLANRNGPTQGVLSGTRDGIAAAEAACRARKMRIAKLNVGAAFHSALVAPAAEAFATALSSVALAPARVPVIGNTEAAPYPADEKAARALLANQLAKPVRFDEVIERLYASGARTFLEVGPKTALTGMVKAVLEKRSYVAVAVDAQSRHGGTFDFAMALAQVAAAGHSVRLSEWGQIPAAPRASTKPPRVQKMSVPLTGANYRAPVAPIPPRAPKPVVTAASAVVAKPVLPSVTDAGLAAALRQNDESLRALMSLQEQTARVHQRFLEGQQAAQQSLFALATGSELPVSVSAPVVSVAPVAPVAATNGHSHTNGHAKNGHTNGAVAQSYAPPPKVIVEAVAAPSIDPVAILLDAVAEATGYPRETLELKMDLEADLGIDSIKRVEILSLISRRIPGAPKVNPEQLGGLRTLQQVADFVAPGVSVVSVPMKSVAIAAAPMATVNVEGTLLSTISELTGYPVETLSMNMELEADLGIDSIKRVEILSLLSRRIPNAPSVNPEKLSSLKTLAQVRDFIGSSVSAAPVMAATAVSTVPTVSADDIQSTLLSTVSELTGYPLETLSMSMDLEADLGIDSIKRVEILSLLSRRIPNAPSVNPEKLSSLKTLAQVRDFIASGAVSEVAPAAAPVVARPETASSASTSVLRQVVVPVRAAAPSGVGVALPSAPVVVLRDADSTFANALARAFERAGVSCVVQGLRDSLPAAVGGLVVLAPSHGWSDAAEADLKAALSLAREASPKLRATANSFFVTVTRRDGAFGFANPETSVALDAGLAGLAKTLSSEWPEVRCRAFDVSAAYAADEAAVMFVEELTNDGPRELGVGSAGRVTLAMTARDAVRGAEASLKRGDVVLVTGGARGVTAQCIQALARETGCTLVLLGRSALGAPEAPWSAAAKDEAALKRALLEHAPEGQKPSPKQLGAACRQILAAREVRATLEALSTLGVRAEYREVDVRDAAAVTAAVDYARTLGPVRGVVHGAGVLRDKRIEDKRADDFDQVLDPKLAGLRGLLEATRADALTLVALFTSVTGRFGRKGQSDYAVANQALVGVAQAEALRRPMARVVALDWGPWAGGMVTPALEATFRAEGITPIPLAAGARAFVDEALAIPSAGVEVVLGVPLNETAEAAWSVARTERIDASWPILADHRLAGREVLPLALVLEWFGAAATRSSNNRVLIGLDEVRLLRGVTLTGTPESLAVWVGPSAGDSMPLELRNAKDQVQVRAVARFASVAPVVESASLAPTRLAPFTTSIDAVYREQLFHGPRLHAIEAIEALGEEGMQLTLRTHSTSERLVPGAPRAWVADPLVYDGIFQALIVWTRARLGAPSLPSRVDAIRWFGLPPESTVRAVVRVRSIEGASVVSDVELINAAGALVARLTGYHCTVSATLVQAFENAPSTARVNPTA